MLTVFRDLLVNLAATVVGDLSSPTGTISYIVIIGAIALWIIGWHRKMVSQGKRGLDSWYFISLAAVVAIIAIATMAYGIGRRTVGPARETISQGIDTYLGLKFGPEGTTPTATELANIWRWYALASIVRFIQPNGQQKDIKTWNLFMTFDKPVDVKQVI